MNNPPRHILDALHLVLRRFGNSPEADVAWETLVRFHRVYFDAGLRNLELHANYRPE